MSNCKRCGAPIIGIDQTSGKEMCVSCRSRWAQIDNDIVTYLKRRHGPVTHSNRDMMEREYRRLMKLWQTCDRKLEETLGRTIGYYG